MRSTGIHSVFHYVPLHKSEYYQRNYGVVDLPITEKLSSQLIRLPMFYNITEEEVNEVISQIHKFYNHN